MIDEIIKREWDFFQQIHHIDGVALCQQDYNTFYIMRASQFEAWSKEVVESYLGDLKEYQKYHQNPIYQKYGLMMKSNDPKGYQKIKHTLLTIDQDKLDIIEEIIMIQLQWKESFNQQYPHLANSSRPIYSYQDTIEDTSFETYLRGELSTYLDKTLYLYGNMIIKYLHNNQNLTTMITENTAHYYQYSSLADIKQ